MKNILLILIAVLLGVTSAFCWSVPTHTNNPPAIKYHANNTYITGNSNMCAQIDYNFARSVQRIGLSKLGDRDTELGKNAIAYVSNGYLNFAIYTIGAGTSYAVLNDETQSTSTVKKNALNDLRCEYKYECNALGLTNQYCNTHPNIVGSYHIFQVPLSNAINNKSNTVTAVIMSFWNNPQVREEFKLTFYRSNTTAFSIAIDKTLVITDPANFVPYPNSLSQVNESWEDPLEYSEIVFDAIINYDEFGNVIEMPEEIREILMPTGISFE